MPAASTLPPTIFGGSRFPGSVNYSKAFNSEGNYAVPGLANYVTHGNSDTFGINWSENIPNAPSFSVGFQRATASTRSMDRTMRGKTRFIRSTFIRPTSGGFNMGAFYTTGDGHSLIPQVVSGVQDPETQTDSNTYGFNVTHRLPLEGSFSAGINRSDWNTEYQGTSTSGTVDLINALAAMHPSSKLSLSASANYSDNLNGQLVQSVAGAGGAVPGINSNEASNSLDLLGSCQLQSRIESANLGLCRAPHPILSGRELRSEFLRWERHLFSISFSMAISTPR